MQNIFLAFCVCALYVPVILVAGSPLKAQTVDYGASEQLFGEPVTSSVTGSPERASDVPATMEIITADDIRRSGANDIPGVLRHVPGLDVLRWRNDDADVAVRGYNQAYSPRLLVLIDGRQVYADYYGYTPWTALPVELGDIRQIEVVKGPGSALFGFNAAGGVINIITYNPLYDRPKSSSIGAGTQSLVEGSLLESVKLGNAGGARISAGGRSNDDFSTPDIPLNLGVRRGDDRGEINARIDTHLGRNVVAEFEASTSASDEPELTLGNNTYYAHYATKSAKLQLSAETKLGIIKATAYSNWISVDATNQQNDASSVVNVENQVAVAQLEDLLKVGNKNAVRFSLEYRHNAMPTESEGAEISYNVASAAGMWDWTITPALSLTNAVRLDHLTLARSGPVPAGYPLTNADWDGRSLTQPSFNSGFVWRPDASDTYRLTVAQGIQVPSLFELGGLLLRVPYGFVSGIPILTPGIVTNYELGWNRTLPGNTKLRVSAYHETASSFEALLAGSDPSAGLFATPASIGGSDATGVEIALDGAFGKDWRWGASYTPESIKDRFAPGFTLATTGVDFTHTTPVHVAGANLGWAHGRFETDGYLRYESAFYGIERSPAELSFNGETLSLIPSYVAIDARVGYAVNDRMTLSLSGQNLMHDQQIQTSGPAVERRVIGSVKMKF